MTETGEVYDLVIRKSLRAALDAVADALEESARGFERGEDETLTYRDAILLLRSVGPQNVEALS